MKEIYTVGDICLDDEYGFVYKVAKIEYFEREDETYKYIFTPDYSVINLLDSHLFQGIPGMNLDLKRPEYIRENVVPVFISERTPSKNREDLVELLEECGMDYLNRLEWLIRTDTRYSGDKLYVLRHEDTDSMIEIQTLDTLGNRSAAMCRRLLELICYGRKVCSDEIIISDLNRREIYELLMTLYKKEKKYIDGRRKAGIKESALKGNYKGRTRKK